MAKPDYAVWLAGRLHQLCEDEQSSDFTLLVGDASVRCHKVVVSACSEPFRTVCREGRTAVRLNHEGSYEECRRIAHDIRNFIYLGTVSLSDSNVEILLRIADTMGHQRLIDECENFLLDHLSADNGHIYEEIARSSHLRRLSERCERFKKEHFTDVMRTGWFQDMSRDDAYHYLQARDTQTGCEDSLLMAVHLWMQNHPGRDERTEGDFGRLYSLVRIELCTERQMLSIANDENISIFLQNKLFSLLFQRQLTLPGPSPSPPIPIVPPVPPAPPTSRLQPRVVVVGGRQQHDQIHAGILTLTTEWRRKATAPVCQNVNEYSVAAGESCLFFSGGYNVSHRCYSSAVSQFSLQSLQWSALTDLPVPRERHGSACVNAKLCIFGGQVTHGNLEQRRCSRVDILDLSTGIRSQGQRMPHPTSHAGVAVSRTDIIVVGGDVNGRLSTRTQMYKVDTNQWIPLADMPVSREYASNSTVAVDRSVYVLAGADFLQYDIGTNQWTPLDQRPPLTRMWSAMVLDSGKLRAIGGLDVRGVVCKDMRTFDLERGTWTVERENQLSFPLAYHSAFVMYGQ